MRPWVLKQFFYKFCGKTDLYRAFDKNNVLFIHIPKSAGTSVSEALYGEDTWHYSAKELKFINRHKFNEYYKFAVVRHPLDRIISTYRYAQSHIQNNQTTSLSFMRDYISINDFIDKCLDDEFIHEHYFFWKQADYVCNFKGKVIVDRIIKFENLATEIYKVSNDTQIELNLRQLNKSQFKISETVSKANKEKVYRLYKDDFELFDYELN